MMSKADTHIHTRYSGWGSFGPLRFPESVSDPRDVVKKAHSMGFRVVCITDHNSIDGAVKAREYADSIEGIEVVMGEEVSTADGEIIGLFLNEEIPPGMSAKETISKIRDQGGVVIAPHPFSLHCPALGEKIDELDIDGIEILNAGHIDSYANRTASEWSNIGRWADMGGSDSHVLSTIGDAYTLFEGETAEDLRKAILNRTTTVRGGAWRLEKAIHWSIGVVVTSDVLMLKSMLGLIREADMHDDPILHKISVLRTGKKFLVLFGSILYLIPPIPFLCGITGQQFLKRKARIAKIGRKK